MQFNHYGGEAAKLAAALINIADALTPATLELLLQEHKVAHTHLTAAENVELKQWIARLVRQPHLSGVASGLGL